jgi:CheY-like chemotaxis protein
LLESVAVPTSAFVLLVDDIPDHVHVYGGALRARGYRVQLVHTAAEALAFCAKTTPHCVVIDIRLPDLPGWELCSRLKADPRNKKTPIILLAPDLSNHSVTASRAAGCASWLMRPAIADDVARAVEHVLAHGASEPDDQEAAVLTTQACPACTSDKVRAGVRIGPVQYWVCRACNVRWRIEAPGEATA